MGDAAARALLLAASALAAPAAAGREPRFAEELAPEVGYAAVFRLSLDEAGVVGACTLQSVRESLPDGPAASLDLTPRFVAEACRKLAQRTWRATRAADGRVEPVHYFCRYVEATPDTAYCERRFGE